MRGLWDPLDVMTIREAAVTDKVPKISRSDYEALSGREAYNFGHAAFEFIEARYGKEGIRQFLYTWRKNHRGREPRRHLPAGLPDQARGVRRGLREVAEGALQALPRQAASERLRQEHLAEPRSDVLHPGVLAAAASPSGEMVAVVTGNRSDGEADIVLLSCQGRLGHQQPHGRLHVALRGHLVELHGPGIGRSIAFDPERETPSPSSRGRKRAAASSWSRYSTARSSSASPSPSTRRMSPCLPPRREAHALLRGSEGRRVGHLAPGSRDRQVQEPDPGRLLRPDPQVSPDGKLIVYSRRVSGYAKLYSLPRRRSLEEDPADVRHLRRRDARLLARTARRSTTPPTRTTRSSTCAASTSARGPSSSTPTPSAGQHGAGAAQGPGRRRSGRLHRVLQGGVQPHGQGTGWIR